VALTPLHSPRHHTIQRDTAIAVSPAALAKILKNREKRMKVRVLRLGVFYRRVPLHESLAPEWRARHLALLFLAVSSFSHSEGGAVRECAGVTSTHQHHCVKTLFVLREESQTFSSKLFPSFHAMPLIGDAQCGGDLFCASISIVTRQFG
jgi:hypothetical protein